jgi:hypothetical protein
MACRTISKKADRTCAGRRDKKVEVFSRDIAPADISFKTDLTSELSIWCSVETKRGVKIFDGTNTNRAPDTTIFYTAYGVDIESEQILSLNGKYFEVDRTDNMNMENRTLAIICVELGDIKAKDGITEIKTSKRR